MGRHKMGHRIGPCQGGCLLASGTHEVSSPAAPGFASPLRDGRATPALGIDEYCLASV